MAEFRRPFDEPVVVQAEQGLRQITGGVPGPPVGQQEVICQASGVWNCCDLWVQWPQDWINAGITCYLKGESGQVTSYFDLKTPADLEIPFEPQGIGTGLQSGILFSVRGRTCERFTFGAFNGRLPAGRANFRLHVWGTEDGATTDQAARQVVTPYAHREETLQPTIGPLAAGGQVLIPQHPMGPAESCSSIR